MDLLEGRQYTIVIQMKANTYLSTRSTVGKLEPGCIRVHSMLGYSQRHGYTH